MTVADIACSLMAEAAAVNERRLLVLAGDREQGYQALESVLSTLPVAITDTTLVGPDDRLRCEQLTQTHATHLLGTTRTVIVLDAHEKLEPNALGRVVGAVDGGGLLIVLTPPLGGWADRRDAFDESIAIPPCKIEDVGGAFRTRLVETLRAHRGIAIYDCDRQSLECDPSGVPRDGRTRPPPSVRRGSLEYPTERTFPTAAYEACYTQDQVDALCTFETLTETGEPRAVVIDADRGRGKSSAAGLAAASLAAAGSDVLVTAPAERNCRELFTRATDLLEAIRGPVESHPPEMPKRLEIQTETGGSVRYYRPEEAVSAVPAHDVVLVDEAAALPVGHLESLSTADRIGFVTTIHGYEGAGRGFSVRFQGRLEESDHQLKRLTLTEPIRYAAGDPLEVWAFRALLLDARPAVAPLVSDATVETVRYRRLTAAELLADEHLLREVFGLLVVAHYRTEPNDLARLLDAPNLSVRALCHNGHVVSVALLAREGGLSAERRRAMYEGERIRGNMLPDVLTSQLRDEAAGDPVGQRVMRIATHHAVRSRGLGSKLLREIRGECAETVDWLGTSFGATQELLTFWDRNGYSPVHLSTTRNVASGEHSVLMCLPTSPAGQELHDRHATRFSQRLAAICSAPLSSLEPDIVRAVCRSVDATPPLELTAHEWEIIVGVAYGPGLIDVDPGPFRTLVIRYLLDTHTAPDLTDRDHRLLIVGILQGHPWAHVASQLGYDSPGSCHRALGRALRPLVDRYGTEAALTLRDRFLEDDNE